MSKILRFRTCMVQEFGGFECLGIVGRRGLGYRPLNREGPWRAEDLPV